MLPLTLLKTAQQNPVLIELKNGETYNGRMLNCDSWMNIHLDGVICTSKDGDRFWKMPEAYIRGNTIKYIRVPEEIIDKVQEEQVKPSKEDKKPPSARGRGGRGWSVGGRDGGREGGRGGRGEGRGRGREGGGRGGRGRG